MKIILIGYMGSGKSTVGSKLATRLNLVFKDLDTEIEQREKMSLSALFDIKGELYFRKLEMQVVKELLDTNESFVLATGGGTPCYGDTMNSMLHTEDALVIYLRGTVNHLMNRLKNEKDKRPMLAHLNTEIQLKEWIGMHLFERSQFYNKAHHIISIDSKSVEQLVDEILEKITLK
ncbi:MAG: shikimate kinase [Bacteroidetes bacterium]|jgi:shikimate kinase|nr:shikimate kinase [Bacteroidota bacterium]